MDFLKKRISKATKEKDSKEEIDQSHSVAEVSKLKPIEIVDEIHDFNGSIQQQRYVQQQTNRRIFVTTNSSSTSQSKMVESLSDFQLTDARKSTYTNSDHLLQEGGGGIEFRTPSPFRSMNSSRSMFAFDQNKGSNAFENLLANNGSNSYRSSKTIEPVGDESSRRSMDTLSLLRQCEGSSGSIIQKRSSPQNRSIEEQLQIKSIDNDDPMDLIIEATLQKTVETFQRMVDDQRAELVRMFPQLANVRRTATADQGPATEVVTETRVQPDGSVIEVQTTRTRRVMAYHKSINIVNGVVKNTHARAVMEYQGPNGGYRLKLEEDAGRDAVPDADSETEEDDDDSDRLSLAPSEFSDTVSVVALAPRKPMGEGGTVPQLQVKPKRKTDKAWYAAQELVESERRYVEKLKLLDQVFRTRVEKDPETAKSIGGDKLAKLFSNIGTLYAFHQDHLLPQLENKLREWRETQTICDVMRRQAPFLKIYGEYTGNYKKATKTFDDLKKSNKRFAAIIDEIEKLPECDHLPLSNHLICPVQRVTRYHLLMTEYLKNLGDGHPDKEDTQHALELTKEAALHANQMMRQLDKYKNVIEVQELLGSQVSELLTPSRELVKKGRLMKISARNGEHQTRFVFLFNDMLLMCSERRNMMMSAWSGKYKLRAIFEVDGMNVLEGDNLDVENTFYVRSGNKVVELYTSEAKEKAVWMETLWSIIQDYNKRMQSFRKPDDNHKLQQAPNNVNPKQNGVVSHSNNAESCSNCAAIFNAFKKAYVCKSCGASLCKKCCQKKVKLHDSDKEQRVCLSCFETLKTSAASAAATGSDSGKNTLTTSNAVALRKATMPTSPTQQISRKSILEVRPSDTCIWSGYLDLKTANRKSWDRRFFALQQDFVLYTFKTEKDVCAKTSLPITGCRVSWVDPRQDSTLGSKDVNAFKLEHGRRIYYLKATSPESMAKCVAALELASQAQLPAFGA